MRKRESLKLCVQMRNKKVSITKKSVYNGCPDFNAAGQTKSSSKDRLVSDEDDITIYTGICVPLEVQTFGGKMHFATFTIAKSRYCDVGLLSARDQVGDHFEEFVA